MVVPVLLPKLATDHAEEVNSRWSAPLFIALETLRPNVKSGDTPSLR